MNAFAAVLLVTLSQSPASKSTYSFKSDLPAAELQQVLARVSAGLNVPKPGQWVRYELTRNDGTRRPKKFFLQMSVVGAEKDEQGRDAVWVETEYAMHPDFKAPLLQMRTLNAVNTKAGMFTSESVSRAMLAFGPEKPKEASKEVVEDLFKDEPNEVDDDTKARALNARHHFEFHAGKPTALMTHAGTLTAIPVEAKYKSIVLHKYWLSEQIPLFKLAKMEVPKAGHSMEIRDYGFKARSRMVLPGANDPKLVLGDVEHMWRNLQTDVDEANQ